jgi:hypothetical protein
MNAMQFSSAVEYLSLDAPPLQRMAEQDHQPAVTEAAFSMPSQETGQWPSGAMITPLF